METFQRYLPFVRGIHRSPVNSPHKGQWRDVFIDLSLNKRSSNKSRGWWFETPSRSLWRHCNVNLNFEKSLLTHTILYSFQSQWVIYKFQTPLSLDHNSFRCHGDQMAAMAILSRGAFRLRQAELCLKGGNETACNVRLQILALNSKRTPARCLEYKYVHIAHMPPRSTCKTSTDTVIRYIIGT